MIFIIDRFEGDIAVLEDENGGHSDVLRGLIPKDSREGDVLELRDGEYIKRSDLTEIRRERIIGKSKRLFKKRTGSD